MRGPDSQGARHDRAVGDVEAGIAEHASLVVDDAVREGDVATFEVEFNGVTVPVRSTDGIPSLFQPGRPVVMEGHFAAGEEVLFLADRVLVKHDETYEADNADRIDDAEDGQSG